MKLANVPIPLTTPKTQEAIPTLQTFDALRDSFPASSMASIQITAEGHLQEFADL